MDLSIIIATYNRADTLRTCLERLTRQTEAAASYEVVVVVDGSTDHTLEMLGELAPPFALHVISQPNRGQAAALNAGLAVAQGRFVIILDDDISAAPELVAAHLRAQRAGAERAGAGQGVVGLGRLLTSAHPGEDQFAHFMAQWLNGHYERLDAGRAPEYTDCYSGNMSAPRSALLEVGGFATDLPASHDVELGYRLANLGLSFAYVPAALGRQDYLKSTPTILAEAERYGQNDLELLRRHPPMLAHLQLARFGDTTLRQRVLWRLLLALSIPASWLTGVGSLFGGGPLAEVWFRFLHDYGYWRGVRRAVPDRESWRRITSRTPILMYHAFAGSGEPASRFVLPASQFQRQLALMRRLGYTVISLAELARLLAEHQLPLPKTVVLTIDDGYADNLTVALPLLRRYGATATLFLVSGDIGDENRWDATGPLADRKLLTWPEIDEMRAAGIAIGSHATRHLPLAQLSPADAVQMLDSRAALEHKLGHGDHPFCLSLRQPHASHYRCGSRGRLPRRV